MGKKLKEVPEFNPDEPFVSVSSSTSGQEDTPTFDPNQPYESVKKKDETTVSPEPEDGSTQREWVAGGSGSQGRQEPSEKPTKTPGFWKSLGQSAADVLANQVPQIAPSGRLANRPQTYEELVKRYPTYADLTEEKFKSPDVYNEEEDVKMFGINTGLKKSKFSPELQKTLGEDLQRVKEAYPKGGKEAYAMFKDLTMARVGQANAADRAEVAAQQEESAKRLEGIPNTRHDINSFTDFKSYMGKLVGQAAGSSVTMLAGGSMGSMLLEMQGAYEDGIRKVMEDNPGMTREEVEKGPMRNSIREASNLAGAVNSVLERASFGVVTAPLKRLIVKEVAQEVVKRGGKELLIQGLSDAGKAGASEGFTEWVQNLVTQTTTNKAAGRDPMDIDWDESFENLIGGVVGGTGITGGLGGVTSTYQAVRDKIKSPQETIVEQKAPIASSGDTQAIETAADAIEKSVENQPTEGVKDDSQNITRPSGEERVGQEPVQAQPEQGGGNQETQTGGVVQSPQEEVTKEQEFTPPAGDELVTQSKVQLPADINLSNRKQASDSFRKIKEELENDQGEDDIQTLLVNWNDSELVDDGNGNLKIKNYVGRDSHISRGQDAGALNESKADFIKWLFSDKPLDKKKYDVDKAWTDLVNRARAAIGQKEGTQRVFVYGTLQDAATRKKALGEDVTAKRTTIPGFTKQEGEFSTIEKGKGEVKGQMLELTPEQVAKLDKYEEKYDRQEIRPGVFAYVRKSDVNEKGQDKNRPSDEVLNIVRQYEEEAKNPKLDPKDMAIAAVIGKVNRGKYGDANTITSGMAKTYLRKDGTPIDVVAQNASKEGQEVTPDDVWDFMQRYPGGPQTMSTPAGNPKLRQLSDRYAELTGKAINRRTAAQMAEKYKEAVGIEKANTESSKFFDPKTDEIDINKIIEEMEADPEGYMAHYGIDQEHFDHQLNAAYNERDKQGPPDQTDREDGGTPGQGQETLRKRGPLSVRFGDTSQDVAQLVEEITSKPLTHVPGLNMGKGLAAGTYLSTEEKNRYEGTPQKATVNISNPFVFKSENGIIPFRNQVLEDNHDQFTDEDFESGEKSSWILTLEDLSNKGIGKLAELVRSALMAEGYDSIYLPATETQEGELIVFDKANVTLQEQSVFAKAQDLYNQIQAAESAVKKRGLAEKRRNLLEQNPQAKFIDDNLSMILSELEQRNELTKRGDCP